MRRYAFCPVCGTPFDNPAAAGQRVDVLTCTSCAFEFWQNSKPAVGALIAKTIRGKQSLLLCRRGIEPHKGMWDLPGGYLNNGEHPDDGLAREIREELGASLERHKLFTVGITEYPREDIAQEARFVIALFYVCEIQTDATLTPMDDVEEIGWFPLDELPDGIAFDANRRAVEAFRKTLTELPDVFSRASG